MNFFASSGVAAAMGGAVVGDVVDGSWHFGQGAAAAGSPPPHAAASATKDTGAKERRNRRSITGRFYRDGPAKPTVD
jgi:hypothetical protein